VKNYIRYIGDRRLQQLNLEPIFGMDKNPLPWMDEMLNGAEHTNFFENRSTEYSKASTGAHGRKRFPTMCLPGSTARKSAESTRARTFWRRSKES
jgi:ribonucleoside-diphosphate reductase beta chain